jgi:hypothetical protein
VWQNFSELTGPLQLLSSPTVTPELLQPHISNLQLFVTKLYGVSEDDLETGVSIDAARRFLFLHKGKQFQQLPPSSDAFYQHLLRVAYQVG